MRSLTPVKIVIGVVVLAVVAIAAAYFLFFTDDSPPPLTLSQTPGTTAAAAAQGGSALSGTWRISDGSVVGYRVREKLARLPAQSDAVGRTSAVTGQVTIIQSGSTVTASDARFEADLTKLASDEVNRDNRIKTQGLQSNTFPTATFVTTEPIRLTNAPTDGQVVKVNAVGDLTLHGVTKRVTIPMDGRLSSGKIELVGSLRFPMSDFAIDPPNVGGFVTVDPEATMEFQLMLQKG
jgi:polyisoprenoid-binding protein YceI